MLGSLLTTLPVRPHIHHSGSILFHFIAGRIFARRPLKIEQHHQQMYDTHFSTFQQHTSPVGVVRSASTMPHHHYHHHGSLLLVLARNSPVHEKAQQKHDTRPSSAFHTPFFQGATHTYAGEVDGSRPPKRRIGSPLQSFLIITGKSSAGQAAGIACRSSTPQSCVGKILRSVYSSPDPATQSPRFREYRVGFRQTNTY